MKERIVKVPIEGTKLNIHAVLRGDFSSMIVILTPGLGGAMNETLMYNAARYLDKAGISSLRVSFVGYEKDQRNISDFDIKTNSSDIDVLVDYVKKQGTNKVCVVGHSYSGMAIVYSDKQQFDLAVLWDPSHTDSYKTQAAKNNLKNDFIYHEGLNSYVSAVGPGRVISKKVFDNAGPSSAEKARGFKVDTLIINADYSSEMKAYGSEYEKLIKAKTKRAVIPGSTHPFYEDGAMEKLFKETLSWIKERS